ncbi:MAG TPA: AAA family ATPase [Thermogutta sp.]|nr:AAA family ATPase [Thermogutta sp.]
MITTTTTDGVGTLVILNTRATCRVCDGKMAKGEEAVVIRVLSDGRRRYAHSECVRNGYIVPTQREDRLENEEEIEKFDENEPQHEAFAKVRQLAQLRVPIFLPGPAGCGKTHLAHQVAKALGLRFGTISCSAGMSEAAILGRRVPGHGGFIYEKSLFVDLYENGGVFLFDEIDAADPNVLLIINSAVANGTLAVPARTEKPIAKRHPDFIIIAAANTFGRGADRLYVGRNTLDESTLDRFRLGTVPLDYDKQLENRLCPDKELLDAVWRIREAAGQAKLRRIVSTRFIKDAHMARVKLGWSLKTVINQLVLGWSDDELKLSGVGSIIRQL